MAMLRHVSALCLLAGWLLTGPAAPLPSAAPPEQTAAPRVRSWTAPPDTLRHRVAAGQTLILNLPDSLGGRPVRAYTILRPPALSRLVERSWVWRTRPSDAGRHRILATATFRSEPPDTLVVEVVVE